MKKWILLLALFAIGSKVFVEWRETWYKAEVVGFERGCTLIHFEGYSSAWDECVGENRIKSR